MNADAASDVMNECVDGWVEDVESDQMQSERKKESDQWPAAIENEDLTGTGQLAISEPERSFHPKIFHSASYLRFKQIAGPKNIQHNEIQGKMTLEMVELLLTKEIANMKMIWMNEARCGWGLWPDIVLRRTHLQPTAHPRAHRSLVKHLNTGLD